MTTTKQYDYLNRLTQISSAPSASYTAPLAFNYNYNPANQQREKHPSRWQLLGLWL